MKQSRKFLMSLLAFVMLLSCARVPQQSTDNSFKSGLAKHNDGDYTGAVEDYTDAITMNPEDASAYKDRAKARCKLADAEFARGNVEKARDLYHAGVADYDKSIKLKKSADADASTTDLASEEGRASTVRVMRWNGTLSGFFYGSGFFVDIDKIATNIHVVASPGPVFVKLTDREVIWRVETVTMFDVENDLVILKISGEGPPLPLENSDTVEIGESIIAVGYPGRKYKVMAGTIHSTKDGGNLLVTTADSSSGSSGGPVLNSKNQVIGVHARSDNSYSFEIPSNILKGLLAVSERTEPLVEWRQRKRIRAYVYFKKGQNRSNAADYDTAITEFNRAIQLNPAYARAYFKRGFAKSKIGDSAGAIDDYTHAIKFNPKYTAAYYNRANGKRDYALYEAAIKDYTVAIGLTPKYDKGYHNRGRVKYLRGKSEADKGNRAEAVLHYRAAIDDYTEAINLNSAHVLAYYNRGDARKLLGQHEAAKKDFEKAKELERAAKK
ncbi:MAG: tetratricopeptide repeat protein [Candidatus Poribacteria bacterium]|nr:tetratricopeptide repeat protein [Candidatus Poribacteria bacterium]